MNILIVDDESLARQRLRTLLEDMPELCGHVLEAAAASHALDILQRTRGNAGIDVVLLDIQMPGMDGVQLAQALRDAPAAPAIVFVTAHAEFATQAFDIEAADYLTKPVRSERLRQALRRTQMLRRLQAEAGVAGPAGGAAEAGTEVAVPAADAPFVIVNERHRTERVLVEQILFCRAEMKYVTLHTLQREYLFDGSLNELERRFPGVFLRIHRSILVARKALRSLVKAHAPEEGEYWRLQLHGTQEALPVSRRMLPSVRAVLHGEGG